MKKGNPSNESSRDDLQLILDFSPDIICTIGADGKFLRVSAAAEKVLGYLPAEMEGRSLFEFIHEADHAKTAAVGEKVQSEREISHFENHYLHKAGHIVPIIWTCYWDIDQQLLYSVGRDGTKKKKAEEQLAASEKRFRTLVENSVDSVAILSPEGWPTYVSPSIVNVLGYTEEEALALNLGALMHPDDVGLVNDVILQSLQQPGIPQPPRVARAKHKNGSWRWIEATITNMLHDPDIHGLVDNFRDVTERVEAEQQLRESEKNYRHLFDMSPLPKWIFDLETLQILDANQAAFDSYGYTREEFTKLKIDQLSPDGSAVEFLARARQAEKKTSIIRLGVFLHQKKNGEVIRMDISGKAIAFQGRCCMIVVSVDVTEQALVQQLQHLEHTLMEESIKLQTGVEKLLLKYLQGLEQVFPSMKASVLRVHDGRVWSFVSPSLPEAYSSALNGQPIGPKAGSCGTAAFTKERVVVEDITTSPLWTAYSEAALEHDLRACWSQPILNSKDEVIATFANYYPVARKPSPNEFDFFSRSASLLSIILENQQQSEKLRASMERYEYVNKATNDAIYEWDVNQDIFNWGSAFQRVFGHVDSNEPFRLADWAGLMHPNDRRGNQAGWDAFMADPQQNLWHKEFRFRYSDGRYAYVEEIGHMIRDKKGRPLRMIGVLRDVSVSKKAELQKQLQHQIAEFFKEENNLQETLAKVLKYLADFGEFQTSEIWIASQSSPQLHLMSIYTADELHEPFARASKILGKFSFGEGLPGTVWNKKQAEMWDDIDSNPSFKRRNAAKKAGLTSAFALPLFHNDDPVGVLVMCSSEPLLNDTSKTDFFHPLGSFLASEIKRKQQEEEMLLLFESAPDILAIASPSGYFAKVNPAFCQLMGYTEEELTSQPFDNFLHPDDRQLTKLEYSETVTGERTAGNFVNRYIARSGACRWISWSSSKVFGEDRLVFAYGRDVTEIKELETLLANATNLARVGAWEIDVATGKTYFSRMTRDIHEVEDDFEPTVNSGIDFYKNEAKGIIRTLIEEGIKEGSSWDIELPLITAKGHERWVRNIGQAEFFEGKCVRLYGSLQDIHERKMAELSLQEAFEERNTILESIGDAFFAVDTHWVVTYWNKEAEIVLGRKRSEVLGRNLWDAYADAVGLKFYSEYHKAAATGKTVFFEEHYPATNQWFEVSAYPSEKGLSVYFKDVSIRKTAEEQIRQANERFETVAQATNDTIWDWDIVNDRLYRGHGFKSEELEKELPTISEWSENIHPDDRAGIVQSVQHALNNKDISIWQHEYRFRNQEGNFAHVIDRGMVIRDKNGKAVRMVGAMTDISYRKEYEESLTRLNEQLEKHARDLEHSNKELEQFAYIASHDLQEPLRMVSSFMTQLNKKYADQLDDKAKQYIHFAVDGAMRMKQIILDLLEFSRVGKHEDKIQDVSLNEVLGEVLRLQHKQIEESKARIHVGQLPIIRTQRSPLLQVMHNLVANALKYHREGIAPEIYVNAKVQELNWLISIKDNGIGIESEYFEKIFIIFQRLHGKDEFSGTGIGLAVVKKIVDGLGGRIWLESEPGHGTTFFFTIPRENGHSQSNTSHEK